MAMRVPEWCGLHNAVFADAANPCLLIAIGWRAPWRCRAAADGYKSHFVYTIIMALMAHEQQKQRFERRV